jgi:hypothetical protein
MSGRSRRPDLGPLQDNGGATATQAIQASSPAHDAGGEAVDQRGVARPQGPACDIGAFELEAPAAAPGDDAPGPGADPGPNPGTGARPDDGPRAIADKVAPTFASASLAPKTFAPRKGTTIRYSLSESARVVFTIERRVGKRLVRVTRFAQSSTAGTNRKRFSGKVGRKALKPGKYRITLVATDGARNASKPKRLSFTVVRR